MTDQTETRLGKLVKRIGEVGEFANYVIHVLANDLIVPHLVRFASKRKLVNDPIWKSIWLEESELGLLDQPIMQRLRFVRQLGLAFLVYPSAQHSRFEHSVGAVQAASRVLSIAAKDRLSTDDYKMIERLIRLSALLHDCGHTCFSHVGEEALKRHPQIYAEFEKIKSILDDEFKDELRTQLHQENVTSPTGLDASPKLPAAAEILSALFVLSPPMSNAAKRLRITEEDQLTIAALILGRSYELKLPDAKKTAYFANSIVSSDLDMDKIDYMARDAYFSGIPISCDVERLMSQLTLCERTVEANGKKHACLVLAILPSGVSNAEMFILARAYLFERLYQHHKIRAAESRLRDVLSDELLRIAPSNLPIQQEQAAEICGLLFNPAGDDAALAALEKKCPGLISSLRSYQRLLALSIRSSFGFRDGKSEADLQRIWPLAKTLMTENRREFAKEISDKLELSDGSILIDWQRPNPIKSFPEIYVADRFDVNKFESIAKYFDISQMALAYHDVKSLGWVFTSDNHREKAAAMSASILAAKTGLCPLADTFAKCNLDPSDICQELKKLSGGVNISDDIYQHSAATLYEQLSSGPLVLHWKMLETFFSFLKNSEAGDLAAKLSDELRAQRLPNTCAQEFIAALKVAEGVFRFAIQNEQKKIYNLSMEEKTLQTEIESFLSDKYQNLELAPHQEASTGILDIGIKDTAARWHVVLELKAEDGGYDSLIKKHSPQAFQYMTESKSHRIGVLFIRFKGNDERRLSELVTIRGLSQNGVQRALICIGEHVPVASASKIKIAQKRQA